MVPNERTTELGGYARQTLGNDFGELRMAKVIAAQTPERKRYLWDAYGNILDEDGNYPEWI